MKGIYHLRGTVKNYDWGGFSFLPSLLNQENPGKSPFAEYWVGTHTGGNTMVELDNKSSTTLQQITGSLSYLLKLLDVRDMLSIQVHPDKVSAQREFERENAAGIPLDDPRRNYRDPNEKPELMVALTEFWLLHGFKPTEELHDILINVTELSGLVSIFHNKGYKGLYQTVMEMTQHEVNQVLQPLADHILPRYDREELSKSTEDFWAARAIRTFNRADMIDRGIFSIYFFNLVKLKKGEGIFQHAGVPHAYLEGRNVEIMGSSDNVLRGGLTNKHIDIKELMKHVKFEGSFPNIISPRKENDEWVYPTPAKEFQLSLIELPASGKKSWESAGNEVLLITEGEAVIRNNGTQLNLAPGSPVVLVSGKQAVELTANQKCVIFKAV